MKSSIIYSFLLIGALSFCFACQDKDSQSVRDAARQSLPQQPDPPAVNQTNPSVPTTASIGGVQHYTCPNNCEGSGGPAAGSCPVCGTTYAHNQAWHNQAGNQAPNPATTTTITPPATPTTPEPAQNAAGVWHYTCAAGCEGGAGSPVACAGCGATLAHNTAYHN